MTSQATPEVNQPVITFRAFHEEQAEAEFNQNAAAIRRAVEHYEGARAIPQEMLEAEVCV